MKNKYTLFNLIAVVLLVLPLYLHSTVYYLKSTGSPTVLANWGTNPDGTGTAPTSFSSPTAHTWNLYNQNSVTLASTWTVSSNATINVGDGTNPIDFILASTSASINTSNVVNNQPTIHFHNASTLRLNAMVIHRYSTSASKTIFHPGNTVVYETGSGAAANVWPFSSPYYNLVTNIVKTLNSTFYVDGDFTINGGANTTLLYLTVGGVLTINNSTLTLLNSTIDLYGSLAGNGPILTMGGNTLNFYGSGDLGTLRLLPTYYIDYFTFMPSSPNTTLTLEGNLYIDTYFYLQDGKLNLNGYELKFDQYSYPDFSGSGTILGNPTSVITFTIDSYLNDYGVIPMDPAASILGAINFGCYGSTITIGSPLSITNYINITEGVLVSNGNVTLIADNNRSARVAPLGTGASISGDVTVQTFAPGGFTGWTLMGSNGVQNVSVADWETQIPMVCEGCIYGVASLGSYFESIQGWKETANDFDTTINVNTTLSPGTGFWVYLGNGFTTTSDLSWAFTGPLQQGPLSLPITSTGITPASGYNLICNPYPSPIDWESIYGLGTNSNNVNGQIHIYNPDIPGFASYTQGGISVNGGTNVIAAGQAFYVLSNSVSTTIHFDELVKSEHNTSANPLLRAASAQKPSLLRLQLQGSYDKDETVLHVHTKATATFDKPYDAYKIFSTPGYVGYPGVYNKYTSISSRDTLGVDYSINSFPANSASVTIPLLVKVSASGNYTITCTEFENYPGCALLHDRLTGSYHNIKSSPYTFNIDDTTSTPRFEVIMCGSEETILGIHDNVTISKSGQGPFVHTHFNETTEAIISIYDITGRKLCDDVYLEPGVTSAYLNIEAPHQIVIIKVTTDKHIFTKKMVMD